MNEFPKSKTSVPTHTTESNNTLSEATAIAKPLLPTPTELVALLNKRIIGHEHAKLDIATATYYHLMSCARDDLRGGKVYPENNNLLLVGGTGQGKSLLFKVLGEILRVPVFHFSCTNIAPYGYKGHDIGFYIDAISRTVVFEGHTHPAIVIWDECDKITDDNSVQGSYHRTVQQDFLKYLEGSLCGTYMDLDSSRILNFATGAFVGLDEIRDSSRKPTIGFGSTKYHQSTSGIRKALPALCPEDLVAFGMIPEFVGRFSRLTSLDQLDSGAMRRILTEAEGNVLTRRKAFFALHGIRLELTDDALDEVVAMAIAHHTGARSLRLIIDRILRREGHRLPDLALQGVTSLVYDREAVLGNAPPTERRCGGPVSLDPLLELRVKAATYANRPNPSSVAKDLGIF